MNSVTSDPLRFCFCQRSTSAVSWISRQQGCSLFNYLNDFIGVSSPRTASTGFQALGDLLRQRQRQDLFYSAQFYRTFRSKLHRQLNTVQLRNKRKKKNVTLN